jgi:hypothetical protein
VATRGASELVAALLVDAAQRSDELEEVVGKYRETLNHQALVTDATEGSFSMPLRDQLDLG